MDLNAETDRYFDSGSLPMKGESCLVLIMGGCATGKTTLCRQKYSAGFVLVDAADIFISLSRGGYYEFPRAFEEPMDLIGRLVASRAISERRNIVTEIIGGDYEATSELIDAMISIDYKVELVAVTCEIEEATRRNISRGDDNISSYFAEPYQRRWLIEAARKIGEPLIKP